MTLFETFKSKKETQISNQSVLIIIIVCLFTSFLSGYFVGFLIKKKESNVILKDIKLVNRNLENLQNNIRANAENPKGEQLKILNLLLEHIAFWYYEKLCLEKFDVKKVEEEIKSDLLRKFPSQSLLDKLFRPKKSSWKDILNNMANIELLNL